MCSPSQDPYRHRHQSRKIASSSASLAPPLSSWSCTRDPPPSPTYPRRGGDWWVPSTTSDYVRHYRWSSSRRCRRSGTRRPNRGRRSPGRLPTASGKSPLCLLDLRCCCCWAMMSPLLVVVPASPPLIRFSRLTNLGGSDLAEEDEGTPTTSSDATVVPIAALFVPSVEDFRSVITVDSSDRLSAIEHTRNVQKSALARHQKDKKTQGNDDLWSRSRHFSWNELDTICRQY